ncbi:MAG: hypothetical protein ACI9LY_001485, partial [Arenicella sp.]
EAFDTHLKNLASGQAASTAVPNVDVKLVLAQ